MSQEDFLEYTVKLELDAGEMRKKSKERKDSQAWQDFVEKFLKNACAARNSPSLDPQNRDQQRLWWIINIDLRNKGPCDDAEFSHRFDDKLVHLLPNKGSLCDVYMMKMDHQKGVLRIDILASTEELSTRDYKTTESTNKGLRDSSALSMDYICNCLYRTPRMDTDLAQRPPEFENLQSGQKMPLSEDARLEYKQLKKEDKKPVETQTAQKQFSKLESGQDYLERIWYNTNRNLPEYISAFTKLRNGGAIYYGVRESKNGWFVDELCLDDTTKEDIRRRICHNIRHDMLWIERNTGSKEGFKELRPEEIRCQGEPEPALDQNQIQEAPIGSQCHFAIDFIKVRDPSSTQATQQPSSPQATQTPSSTQARYLLEVRVAPFNGVVFYDPQGPEAYIMEKKTGGDLQPGRIGKKEWLAKMRDHGWCSKHKVKKDIQCMQCTLENRNARNIPS